MCEPKPLTNDCAVALQALCNEGADDWLNRIVSSPQFGLVRERYQGCSDRVILELLVCAASMQISISKNVVCYTDEFRR